MNRVWWRRRGKWVTAQMMDGDECPVCVVMDLHWHRLKDDGTIGIVVVMDAELESA